MTALLKLESALTVLKLGGVVEEKLTIAELSSIHHLDLLALGFGRWDTHLMLCPLWALELLADGGALTDIFGQKAILGKDRVDPGTRDGLIAYGFFPHSMRK